MRCGRAPDASAGRGELTLNPRCAGDRGRRVRVFRARDLKPSASDAESLALLLLTHHVTVGGGLRVSFVVEPGAPDVVPSEEAWTSLWTEDRRESGVLGGNRPVSTLPPARGERTSTTPGQPRPTPPMPHFAPAPRVVGWR